MAYTINRFSTAQLTVVEDGTIDQTTDLKLVGKNYAGYGEIQNENFVFLLENFAGANQPPRAISGQIWFDTGNSKLKFYDGSKWRTTGGAEISATSPTGLSQGDFWWDTTNEQLYAYNGTDFVLVGPQDAGDGITQMQSKTVRDTGGLSKSIITATVNDEVIFVISGQEFTIDSTDAENAISGFDVVRQGVTLKNTTSATGGVTNSDHRFYGTASNAEKLGGVAANEYVRTQSGVATTFNSAVNFESDSGISIGASADLKLFIEDDTEAVIQNSVGDEIKFRTKATGGLNENVLDIFPGKILPGLASDNPVSYEDVDIGSVAGPFQNVFADNFKGIADSAKGIVYDSDTESNPQVTVRLPKVDANGAGTSYSVAIRDGSGNLNATLFQGTATSARYADLAEKYTTGDTDLLAGTAVAVGTDDCCEVVPANSSDICIGVVSTDPAYMMNSGIDGQYIGLKGRLPVRIKGPVTKGQAVYAWEDGVCGTIQTTALVGIALESNDSEEEKLVECVLKV